MGLADMCYVCSQKLQGSKYYAQNVTIPKPKERTMPEEKLGVHYDVESKPITPQLLEQAHQVLGQGKGTAGVKDDGSKAMWHLLPWKAVRGLVLVLTFGAKKYSPNGWRTVPNARDRYTAALMRHLCAIQMGEKVDGESGLRHIDHLLCNAAFLAELED